MYGLFISFNLYPFYFKPPIFFPSIDLSEPVDVYSDWIDACEAANQ